MSSKKMGRPIIGKLKNIDIKVRIDEDIHIKLLHYCEEYHCTKAEAIRKAVQEMLEKK